MNPLPAVQPSHLPAVNALILRAIDGWDLPPRVKRLAGPSHCYDAVDLATMDVRYLGDSEKLTGVLALETVGVEEAPGQPAWRIHGIYVTPRRKVRASALSCCTMRSAAPRPTA